MIPDVHHAQTRQQALPIGAKDIVVNLEWLDGFNWKALGVRNFATADTYTLKITGAILQPPSLN